MAIKTPDDLGKAGKKLWLSIAGPGKYELRPDEERLLEDAAREADLIATLNDGLADLPLMMKGSTGQDIVNPIYGELRSHRSVLRALMAQLKLPDLDADAVPTSARSTQARAAVNTRWAKRGA